MPEQFTTEQEMMEWYEGSGMDGFPGIAVGISGTRHLNAVGEKQLSTIFHGIQIKNGGELILYKLQLTIVKGIAVPITVEAGGRLVIRQTFAFGVLGNGSADPAIVVEKGGVLVGSTSCPMERC